jgi:rod shape-determining protein MreD
MRVGRTILLMLALLLVQVALMPHLRLLGVVPDLGLVLAVAVAYRHGPEAGALVGFFAGLGFDLFLETPLGLSALSYALAAYVVGVFQAGLLRDPRFLPPFLGGLAGLGGGLTFAAIGVLAGAEGLNHPRTIVVVALAAVYDAVLAPFVFWLVGRLRRRDSDTATGWANLGT